MTDLRDIALQKIQYVLENKNEVLALRKQVADLEKKYKEEIINMGIIV